MDDVAPIAPLPCPFCGQPAEVGPLDPSRDGDAWTYIICGNDDCAVAVEATIHADNTHRADAIAAWNTRTALQSTSGEE